MRTDARLAEIEAKISTYERQARRVPFALTEFLGGLTNAELAAVERLAEILDGVGLELRAAPQARFTREDIEAMSPRDRADAYRRLIRCGQ